MHAGIALSINDYCKKVKMPYFSCCNTPDTLFKKGTIGKYTFPLLNVCGQIGYAGGEYVFKNLGKKAYILVVDYAWGHFKTWSGHAEVHLYVNNSLTKDTAEVAITNATQATSFEYLALYGLAGCEYIIDQLLVRTTDIGTVCE